MATGFGPRLRLLRLANHYTQEQLAEKLQFHCKTIARYENGYVPHWEIIMAIAKALKVDPKQLAGPDYERIYSEYAEREYSGQKLKRAPRLGHRRLTNIPSQWHKTS